MHMCVLTALIDAELLLSGVLDGGGENVHVNVSRTYIQYRQAVCFTQCVLEPLSLKKGAMYVLTLKKSRVSAM